jgi:hypothetical protein
MFRYPDPLDDHMAWEAELARLEKLVPVCFKCKAPIPDDYYYEVEEGMPLCAECLNRHFKKRVEVV